MNQSASPPFLSVVIPVHNEEESLPPLCEKLNASLDRLDVTSEIVFIDDGSTDRTFAVIEEQMAQYERIRAVRFRRNYRKAAALAAGFKEAAGEIIVTMDGDLQDDPDEIPNLVLVPQIAQAVSVPIIVSGGVMDARGFVAAMALGAQGVQLGTRFVATHECIAHPRYKEALLGAIDTGTVIAGRYHWPTRLLRSGKTIKSKTVEPPEEADKHAFWDAELGPTQVRAAILEGNLDGSVAYCGAGVGLLSEIIGAAEVIQSLVEGSRTIIASLR